MNTISFFKNRGSISKQRYNKAYCEVEIEACDHTFSIPILRTEWTSLSNIQAFLKYDMEFIGASNKSNPWTASKEITINEPGEYRILIFGLTNGSYAQDITVETPIGKAIGTQSIKAMDEFIRCYDYGIRRFEEGTTTIKVTGGGQTAITMVMLKKIRKYYGNSDNEGDIKIIDAEFTRNGITSIDTFTLNILNDQKFIDPTSTDYHKSGLVFEYMDSINIKMGESRFKINHAFGGYITAPQLSEDNLTIRLQGVDRLWDAERGEILKEITIGGATTTQTGLTYATNNVYNAMNYILDSMEFPLKSTNLYNVLQYTIPTKYGLNVDLGLYNYYTTYEVRNMEKKIVNTTPIGSCLELRNKPEPNQSQWCILFDSDLRIVSNTPIDIKNSGIFFLQYGMGTEADNKRVITNTVKTRQKNKRGRWVTVYKKVSKTVTDFGYDTNSPFLGWVEIWYSTTPTGTKKVVNIDFTSNTTSNKLGEIVKVVENDKYVYGEFDLISVLNVTDPQPNYYIRRIALVTQTPPQALYDTQSEESARQYKMLFKRMGFKDGSATIPEELKASGKKQQDILKTLCKRMNLNAITIPGKERRHDTLSIEKDESTLANFVIMEDDNLLDVSSINYTPADKLKNAVIKIYKNTNGTYNAVRKVDPLSIAHFGTHSDPETLQGEPGEYNARYRALIDLNNSELPKWSYTAKVIGLPDARIGQLVPCIFSDSTRNEIKTIKSVKCSYVDKGRKVETDLGLDDADPSITAKENVRRLRKQLLPQLNYSGGAEYATAVNID